MVVFKVENKEKSKKRSEQQKRRKLEDAENAAAAAAAAAAATASQPTNQVWLTFRIIIHIPERRSERATAANSTFSGGP